MSAHPAVPVADTPASDASRIAADLAWIAKVRAVLIRSESYLAGCTDVTADLLEDIRALKAGAA